MSKDFELVDWDGEHGPENPRSMSTRKAWLITAMSSIAGLCVTCGSSIYTLTFADLEREFSVSREVCTLGLSLYTLALGVGPLLVAPLSEFYGRRIICFPSLVLFAIWNIPRAVASNMATMLVDRTLSGLAGSAFLSVSAGVIGDVFVPQKLQLPMLL